MSALRATPQRVIAAIRGHHLWRAGDRVLVAVSGGRDSVALLDLLVHTQAAHGGVIEVGTVDHGSRPGGAEDADLVEGLAASLGVPCRRWNLDVDAGASEATLRQARYAALRQAAAPCIATAHHRDDQAETVLVNLLRGAGARGARGMLWRSGDVVRPLLDLGRDALAAWCAARGLAWRDDPTNTEARFLRNRVRAEVLPLFEAMRPGAVAALARAAASAADDDALLELLSREADPGDPLPAAWVAEAPAPLVRRALLRRHPHLELRHVDLVRAVAAGAGPAELPGGLMVSVDGGALRLG